MVLIFQLILKNVDLALIIQGIFGTLNSILYLLDLKHDKIKIS